MAKSNKQLLAEVEAMSYSELAERAQRRIAKLGRDMPNPDPSKEYLGKKIKRGAMPNPDPSKEYLGRNLRHEKHSSGKTLCTRCGVTYSPKQAFFHKH